MVIDYLMSICRKPCTALIYVIILMVGMNFIKFHLLDTSWLHGHSIEKFVKKIHICNSRKNCEGFLP